MFLDGDLPEEAIEQEMRLAVRRCRRRCHLLSLAACLRCGLWDAAAPVRSRRCRLLSTPRPHSHTHSRCAFQRQGKPDEAIQRTSRLFTEVQRTVDAKQLKPMVRRCCGCRWCLRLLLLLLAPPRLRSRLARLAAWLCCAQLPSTPHATHLSHLSTGACPVHADQLPDPFRPHRAHQARPLLTLLLPLQSLLAHRCPACSQPMELSFFFMSAISSINRCSLDTSLCMIPRRPLSVVGLHLTGLFIPPS